VCVSTCVCKKKIKVDTKEENERQKKKDQDPEGFWVCIFKRKLMESNITAETLSSLLSVRAFE